MIYYIISSSLKLRRFNTMNKDLTMIAWILLIIGGLNWGLIGFFRFDLVATIFGSMTMITRIIYALVGISGLIGLIDLFRTK